MSLTHWRKKEGTPDHDPDILAGTPKASKGVKMLTRRCGAAQTGSRKFKSVELVSGGLRCA